MYYTFIICTTFIIYYGELWRYDLLKFPLILFQVHYGFNVFFPPVSILGWSFSNLFLEFDFPPPNTNTQNKANMG